MKVVITVLGKDRVGIIARVSTALAESNVNILDISQTILQDYFTMLMLAEILDENLSVEALGQRLDDVGRDLGVQVRVQAEAIFSAMHRV
ncbi:MAG: ACT domain-containing protein [Acidobacteriota bacterium]|jgi:ACT domain-containing protein|nr:ACT domain-containing protein [Acidobacteriota bacterium]